MLKGSRAIVPEENCPPENRPPPPRTIVPEENFSPENCPLATKFPPKIIAPIQAIPLKEYYEWTENYALYTSIIIKESFC